MGLCEVPATAMTREPAGSGIFPRKHRMTEVSIARFGVHIVHVTLTLYERASTIVKMDSAGDPPLPLAKAGAAHDKHPEAGQ
jgi:hypothetical protein